jgi:iron complex transport system substrate-binding protein
MKRLALCLIVAMAAPAMAEPQNGARRIVSIGGAITEFVYAMGHADRLVARDATSYMPPEAMDLPNVGYMRQLSVEGVLSMRPDMILAEEGAGPPETIALLKSAGIPYVEIPAVSSAEGVIAKGKAIAEALGEEDMALDALRSDLDAAEKAAAAVDDRLRVLLALSAQGGRILAAGDKTEAQVIIEMAGAENAVTGFEGYKPLTDEAVISAAPDVILMIDRGDGSIDLDAERAELLALPAIASTPAGKAGRFIRMNGLYLLGFGPRTGKAALDLNRALYGDG